MNERERFIETMKFGTPDRIPRWECAFWLEALERWINEGMPKKVLYPDGDQKGPTEDSLREYFGFDRSFGVYFRGTVPINIGLYPAFDRITLSDIDDVITEQGADVCMLVREICEA